MKVLLLILAIAGGDPATYVFGRFDTLAACEAKRPEVIAELAKEPRIAFATACMQLRGPGV